MSTGFLKKRRALTGGSGPPYSKDYLNFSHKQLVLVTSPRVNGGFVVAKTTQTFYSVCTKVCPGRVDFLIIIYTNNSYYYGTRIFT